MGGSIQRKEQDVNAFFCFVLLEQRQLSVKDASTGRVDLPGGSAKALKQSIERLSDLDVEYLLCGHPYGHPGIIKGRVEVQENFEFIKRNILL